MHLRSVSLKGFKSFPDRTRLEFSPGVSVVVGPNGSGKSNITDAVLWAFGEQSPLAVRGQSMQDVIFAGAHGVQARSEAEVEVVLDNGDGAVDLPAGEVSISRRLDRAGEGEYRVNGARCRLVDVLEILSDTGLGKEMHSVVSQGRVEEIVTSKPRDRRLLIEEAAGLGKHRKRRRRAQLKLERTQDNLDRALDVEREARARLRPLKRQAEAAELHERLARQTDEARWTLAREDARGAREELASAEADAGMAKADYEAIEAELAKLRAAREEAEAALAARAHEREALANRAYAARSAAERIGMRLEGARSAVALIDDRTQRRRALLAGLEAELGSSEDDDDGADERVAALEAELEQLGQDRHERLASDLAELEERRTAAVEECERLEAVAEAAQRRRRSADAGSDAARRARREVDVAAEQARREAAKVGAELAAVNQFLRSHAGAPGGAPALADALRAEPGYELALAAALGPRLRAAVAGNFADAASLLERAGRDGGAALVPAGDPSAPGGFAPAGSPPPAADAEPLLSHVAHGRRRRRRLARARPALRRLGRRGVRGRPPGLPRRRGHTLRPRLVARDAGAAPGARGRGGPAARRAQPARAARRRHRARRPRGARRAGRGRAGVAGGRRRRCGPRRGRPRRARRDPRPRRGGRGRAPHRLAHRAAPEGARRGSDRHAPRAARRRARRRAPPGRARRARAPRPRAQARHRARPAGRRREARSTGGARGRRAGGRRDDRRRAPRGAAGRARRRPRRGRASRGGPARGRRRRERRADAAARQRPGGDARGGPGAAGPRPRGGGRGRAEGACGAARAGGSAG